MTAPDTSRAEAIALVIDRGRYPTKPAKALSSKEIAKNVIAADHATARLAELEALLERAAEVLQEIATGELGRPFAMRTPSERDYDNLKAFDYAKRLASEAITDLKAGS